MIYFLVTDTRHIILKFNPMRTFMFAFKLMLTSLKLIFIIFKTHFINLIYILLIKIRVQNIWCFPHSTYFLCVSFSRISSTTLLIMALFSIFLLIFSLVWYDSHGPQQAYLQRTYHQSFPGPTFIRRMSGVVNEAGFQFAIRAIYTQFSALSSTLSCHGVSLRRCNFSSIIPAVTSKVGIYPGRFFI